MKLLTETNEHVLVEASTTGSKSYYITGVFLQANLQNRNGRVYPLETLQSEVNRYNEAYTSQNRALGELGHPDGPTINMERVSHLIVDLYADGNNFIGKAKILDTPYGKIVKALIDDGVKLGVSSRGIGSIRERNGVQEVQDDFMLATAADIVADPSAPSAFVNGIMEGRAWDFVNGILTEKRIEQVKKKIKATPSKKLDEVMLREWNKLIKGL